MMDPGEKHRNRAFGDGIITDSEEVPELRVDRKPIEDEPPTVDFKVAPLRCLDCSASRIDEGRTVSRKSVIAKLIE